MKIDRLIGILSILLQEEKTTASELAERFEVSRRTINRDLTWLMTFGAKAEVLEPTEARDIIRRNAEETLQIYMED